MPSKSLHSINSATYPSHNSPTNSTDEPFVINVDGTGFARLDAGTARSDEFTHPAWSPDGSKIACHGRSTLNGMTYCDDVFVMNPDGSETTSLTQSDCSFSDDRPSWSPDGTRVVFGAVHSGPDVTLSVRTVDIIDANGESRIHLTDGSDPAWSPDGSRARTRASTWTLQDGQNESIFPRSLFIFYFHSSGPAPRQVSKTLTAAVTCSWRSPRTAARIGVLQIPLRQQSKRISLASSSGQGRVALTGHQNRHAACRSSGTAGRRDPA